MIRANIMELKNRLSYYLRLIQGRQEIKIIDRKTPLGRIIGVTDSLDGEKDAPWVRNMYDIGVVITPKKRRVSSDFSSMKQVVSSNGNACGVLKALLDERNTGHGKPGKYKGVSGRKRSGSC